MHGVGRHRTALVDGWGHSDVEAAGADGKGSCSGDWEGRGLFLRADQRQPYRIQQGGEPGCDRNVEESDRQDQRNTCGHEGAGFYDPYRRYHPELEGSRVRYG